MFRHFPWVATAILIAFLLSSTAQAESATGSDSAGTQASAQPATGTIVGSISGTFQYVTVESTGAGNDIVVTLEFSPSDEPVANAIGVVAWQSGVRLGALTGLSYTPGVATAIFNPVAAGPVMLQVYSYYPGVAVSYSLSTVVEGQIAPTAAPQPTTAPAPLSADLPATPGQSVTAELPSNAYGSFHYYQFDYPGDGSTRTVTIRVTPAGADVTNAVFLSVYQNGTLLASRSVASSPIPGALALTYSSATPGPVLVQVANYNLARTVVYTLTSGR